MADEGGMLSDAEHRELVRFTDDLIDFINDRKMTTGIVLNALIRVASYVAIEHGGSAEEFVDGVRDTYERVASGGRS